MVNFFTSLSHSIRRNNRLIIKNYTFTIISVIQSKILLKTSFSQWASGGLFLKYSNLCYNKVIEIFSKKLLFNKFVRISHFDALIGRILKVEKLPTIESQIWEIWSVIDKRLFTDEKLKVNSN